MSKNIFGDKLKFSRVHRGWTQEQLAIHSKILNTTIADYEAGLEKPSYDNLRKLAKVLDMSADYLLGLVDEITIAMPVIFVNKISQISGDDRILLDQIIEMLIARRWRTNIKKGGKY